MFPMLVAFTDVRLAVNAPPVGGYAVVSPSSGYGLSTAFAMSTTGWTDDADGYPLAFNFAYQLSPYKGALILSVISPLPYTSSPLPPGLITETKVVTVFASVYDAYGATANASTKVTTTANKEAPATFLASLLSKSLESMDLDFTFQTINLVSSTISSVNCTASPDCAGLHRSNCYSSINTCSSCLVGYKGVVGDSNTKCVLSTTHTGAIGYPCIQNTDCLYHLCSNHTCTVPSKTCQSSSSTTICSGSGACLFYDASKSIVSHCLITNPYCTASCKCSPGYGAVDCSLNNAQLIAQSAARVSMCTALQNVITTSSKSTHLFDTVVAALESAYDLTEILDLKGKVQCAKILRFLATLAGRGFLQGALDVSHQTYTEITSQFVQTNVYPTNKSIAITSLMTEFATDVSLAVASVTLGTIKSMVPGQSPVSLVTSSVRATMTHDLVSSLSSASLSPPATIAESAYGSIQPKVVIPGKGVSACGSGDGYAQLSILLFGSNPHAQSSTLQSPLLQFSSTVTTKTRKKITAKVMQQEITEDSQSSSITSEIAAYYIVLQFSSKQSYNLSIQAGPHSRKLNASLPQCSQYSSVSKEYVSCGNCNISSYTDYNATFGCASISTLCPQIISTRRLEEVKDEFEYSGYGAIHPIENENDNENESILESSSRSGFQSLKGGGSSIGGIGDDDYTPSADDGPASADDEFSSSSQASGSEFASILQAILAELASVLSLNPFNIDLSKAIPVLSFVGSLSGTIIIGLVFFLRWDKKERHQAVYLKEEKNKKIKNRIAGDLIKGGNGIRLENIENLKTTPATEKDIRALRSVKEKPQSVFMSTFNQMYERTVRGKGGGGGGGEDTECRNKKVQAPSSRHLLQNEEVEVPVCNTEVMETLAPTVLVAHFSNQMLPKAYAIDRNSLAMERGKYVVQSNVWMDTMTSLRSAHYMTHAWFGSSLNTSRTLRFLEMTRIVLLGIFIDTLIYGIFFPSDATCAAFLSKATCIVLPSKVVTGATLCTWDKDSGCGITPPPTSVTFTLLVAFIIIIFVIPLDYCVGYIQEEYASKRPELEKWGMTSMHWLGTVHSKKEASTLAAAIKGGAKTDQNDKKGDKKEEKKGDRKEEKEKDRKEDENDERRARCYARSSYKNVSSPEEEMDILMARVKVG